MLSWLNKYDLSFPFTLTPAVWLLFAGLPHELTFLIF